MKKKKIKWGNVCKAIVFVGCIGLLLHDFYMVTIHAIITNQLVQLTWFGLGTLILAIMTASLIYEDFEEQTKNIHSYRPKHAKDIR